MTKLLKGIKQTPEEKLISTIRSAKGKTLPEQAVTELLLLVQDTLSQQVVVHKLTAKIQKQTELRRYINLLCLFYRVMDVDADSNLLKYLATKEDYFFEKYLPRIEQNDVKSLITSFAKHLDNKVMLHKKYHLIIKADVVVPNGLTADSILLLMDVLESLLTVMKALRSIDFSNEGYLDTIYQHIIDIVILEFTILVNQTSCLISIIIQEIELLSKEGMEHLVNLLRTFDNQRHAYLSILRYKSIKTLFDSKSDVIPFLTFSSTDALQKFITHYLQADVDTSCEILREVIKSSTMVCGDIKYNSTLLKPFYYRPLLSCLITDSTSTSNSVSRNISPQSSPLML
ncbi:hypothetical protein QTN25_000583 [Entamoeba marina]